MDRFTTPTLLVGGWYDYYAGETFENYAALLAGAASSTLAAQHRVIIGPWTHGISGGSVLGELDFGAAAAAEDDCTMRWLDCLLHGGSSGDFQEAPIRVFVMGANTWRDLPTWPPPDAVSTPYYLRANGMLLTEAAPADEAADTYIYDPDDPVPTLGGNHSVGPYNPGLYEICRPGPFDQRPVEARDDVLSYTTPPLTADTEVTGPVRVQLYAASSARDTDFVARLVDVHPDGRAMNVTEGILRGRFRGGNWERPALLEPGEVYCFSINLQATSIVFRAGHRLRVDITSSSFPLWSPNRNTGEDPATDTGCVQAAQRVLHDSAHPSQIILPVRHVASTVADG
jgi:putative CocE/NonD family hydrolase